MRNLKVRNKAFILAMLAILLIAASTLALTDPQIPRWTVDGGGGQVSGGGYSLPGSTGQPNTSVMSGSGYTLSGGFWGASPGIKEHLIFLPLTIK